MQYAPELFIYIKIIIDKNHRPGDFWLDGSQIFKLMDGVRESLAGRVAVLNMCSLSQQEVYGEKVAESFKIDIESLNHRKSGRLHADVEEIFERIFRGSMPAVVSGAYSNSNIFYNSYISIYIERDVKEL